MLMCFQVRSLTSLGVPEVHVSTNRAAAFLALAHDSCVLPQRCQAERNGLTGMGNEIHRALKPVAGLATEKVGVDQRPMSPAEMLERFFSDPRVVQLQGPLGN